MYGKTITVASRNTRVQKVIVLRIINCNAAPNFNNSLQVKTASIETGEYCNMLAMKCLQEENFSVCQKLLKKASSLAVFSTALQVATYNNFACLFRKQDKLRLALDFLMKAIDLEATLDQVRVRH